MGTDDFIRHPVARLAVSPSGGEMAEAIAASLREKGGDMEILDPAATAQILRETGIMGPQATLPENLAKLRSRSIDAWLRADFGTHAIADVPQNISVRISSTHDAAQFIDFVWHNAWGGMRGSLADATMRKGPEKAVDEVTDAILERLAQRNDVEP